jgi:hypothetical protein
MQALQTSVHHTVEPVIADLGYSSDMPDASECNVAPVQRSVSSLEMSSRFPASLPAAWNTSKTRGPAAPVSRSPERGTFQVLAPFLLAPMSVRVAVRVAV